MARQDEIARFVAGFFTLNGAVLRWVDAGVLEVEVPEALRSRLGVCRKLRLAFSPRAAESGPDQRVEYLTLGHPLLDRLLDEARSRGRTASVILPHGLDRELLEALSTANPFGTRSSRNRSGSAPAAELREGSRPRPEDAPAAWRDLERRLGRLVFHVVRGVKPLAARLVFHTQVMFFFRVSFISDEKRERTVSLLIDPYTEEIDRPVDLKAAAPFDLGSGGLEGGPVPAPPPLPEGLRPPGEALGQRDRGVPGGGRGAAAQGRAPHRRVLRRLDSRAGRPLAQAVSQDGGGPRRGGAGPLVEHRRALPPGLRRPAAGGRPAGGGVREGAGPAREGEGTAAAGGARKAQGAAWRSR